MESIGLPKNNSDIIDPITHGCKGPLAEEINDNNYSGGVAARVYSPNTIIMETQWYAVDSFTGDYLIYVIYGTDYAVGSGFKLEVWRKLPWQLEGEHDPSKDEYFTGGNPGFNIVEIVGSFNQIYEYKVIIKTTPWWAGTYADIDLVQFTRINKNSYMEFNGFSYDPELSGNISMIKRGFAYSTSSGSVAVRTSVNFNNRYPFIDPPNVLAFANRGGVPPNVSLNYENITTTSFDLIVEMNDRTAWTGTIEVSWVAFGFIKPTPF